MHFSARELIKRLEFPFCYLAYIVDPGGEVDYFHYGLWNKKTDNVKQAQENLAHLMKSLIPDRTKSILDVGCGLGRTVYDFSRAGYHVVGISPDKGLINMAKKRYAGLELRLIECAFENFDSDKPFDLVLFQESTQYINLKTIFSRCRKLLHPDGYILMCDEIKYGSSRNLGFHQKAQFFRSAKRFGFRLLHNEDITESVLNTRKFALERLCAMQTDMEEIFSPVRKNAGAEIQLFIEGWSRHNTMFERGEVGYEVFLFQKGSGFGLINSLLARLLS